MFLILALIGFVLGDPLEITSSLVKEDLIEYYVYKIEIPLSPQNLLKFKLSSFPTREVLTYDKDWKLNYTLFSGAKYNETNVDVITN